MIYNFIYGMDLLFLLNVHKPRKKDRKKTYQVIHNYYNW